MSEAKVGPCDLLSSLALAPPRVAMASNSRALRSFFRALLSGNVFTSIQCQRTRFARVVCLAALPWHPHGWPRLPFGRVQIRGHFGLFSEHYFQPTISWPTRVVGLKTPCVGMRDLALTPPRAAKATVRERAHPPL